MEPVRRIQGKAMPLNRADVDTDQPAVRTLGEFAGVAT